MADIVLQENLLVRMQEDIRRALEKPEGERRWGMVIDTRKCVGCHACTVSCVAENKLPPGVVYRPVLDQEIGEYPNVTRRFMPRPCMQCEEPPCVHVCPVNATYTRPDGIVAIDYERRPGAGDVAPLAARPALDQRRHRHAGLPLVRQREQRNCGLFERSGQCQVKLAL